jgi:hypothetical protein
MREFISFIWDISRVLVPVVVMFVGVAWACQWYKTHCLVDNLEVQERLTQELDQKIEKIHRAKQQIALH